MIREADNLLSDFIIYRLCIRSSIYPSSSLGDPIYTHVSGDNVIFSETPHVLGAEQQSRYSQYDPSKTDIIQIPVQS